MTKEELHETLQKNKEKVISNTNLDDTQKSRLSVMMDILENWTIENSDSELKYPEDSLFKILATNAVTYKPPKKWVLDERSGRAVKCDNEKCNWKSNEITTLDTLHLWQNVPCPKCGMNLLAPVDYKNTLIINAVMSNPIIKFINWIGKKTRQTKDYKVIMNGSGSTKFEEIKEQTK